MRGGTAARWPRQCGCEAHGVKAGRERGPASRLAASAGCAKKTSAAGRMKRLRVKGGKRAQRRRCRPGACARQHLCRRPQHEQQVCIEVS